MAVAVAVAVACSGSGGGNVVGRGELVVAAALPEGHTPCVPGPQHANARRRGANEERVLIGALLIEGNEGHRHSTSDEPRDMHPYIRLSLLD